MPVTWLRNLSPTLQTFFAEKAAKGSRNYNSHVAVRFTLHSGVKLYYATGALTIDTLSVDGASVALAPAEAFSARLSGAPDVRVTQTRAPETGNLEVINLDYLISTAIPDNARPFENCKVRVYLALQKPAGTYEGVVLFDGYLQGIGADDEIAGVDLIGDISSRAAMVGKEIPQRCFNELGDSWCGVPVGTLPPGAVCTKVHNDNTAGCGYWGGVFNGVPFINPNAIMPGYSGSGGGGWDEPPMGGGNPGCPDIATTWFPSANGGFIHARDMRGGEAILNPKGDPFIVEGCEPIWAPYRYQVGTRFGAGLIVSATHPFLRSEDDDTGKPCTSWRFGEYGLLCNVLGKNQIAEAVPKDAKNFNYWFKTWPPGEVLKMAGSAPNTYLAGMEPGLWLGNHNTKPIFGNQY